MHFLTRLRLVRQSFPSYLCQVGSEILLVPGLLLLKVSAPEFSVALPYAAKVSTSEFSVVLMPGRFRNSAPPRFTFG